MVDISDSSLVSLPGDLNLLDFPPLGVASDDGDKVAPMVAATKEGVVVGSGVVVDVAEVAAAAPGSGKVEWNFINQSLCFSPSADICGRKIVQPPSLVLSDGAKQWSNALIGNFLGKSPPLAVFQKTADKLWGKEGSVVIRFLAPSVYMINFPSQRDKCLKGVSAVGGVILKEDESIGASSSKAIVNREPDHVTQDCVVQDCSAQEVSGSDVENANKFAALGDGSENLGFDVVVVDDSRKCRAAVGGVAELMQQLKPKEKVPKKRGKGK
ncbi:hypothetical protein V6N12_001351 [Hibiscus sabdariffa]|uniref:DUF4283 domain-containing protein n=1 Tax=Hibiscus sabdariffa TaxID=183260 RepID=A0ABR2B184_9ROSI